MTKTFEQQWEAFKQVFSGRVERFETTMGEGYITIKRKKEGYFQTQFPLHGRMSMGRMDPETGVCLWWVDVAGFDVQYTGITEKEFLRLNLPKEAR